MNKIFEGVRVIDVSGMVSAPFATALMADQGAEIIKIEKPNGGDDTRNIFPFVDQVATVFMVVNRGKKSLSMPINTPEGKEVLKQLISTADVFVENYRPGAMKKLGLDYNSVREIKPDIIYCSVSAFGQTGPYAAKPGYDPIAQAMSGLMDLCGEPDGGAQRIGTIIGDYCAALSAYGAIASALYHREKTGEGNYIDISITDSLIVTNAKVELAAMGANPTRGGRHESMVGPYGVYSGNDGEAIIVAANQPLWEGICKAIGKPELANHPDFNSPRQRGLHTKEMVDVIEGFLKSYDHIDDAIAVIEAMGVPISKVFTTTDLITDPQFTYREVITDIPVPKNVKSVNSIKGRGMHIKYSNTPGEIQPAPVIGEHNTEILKELGKSDEEIQALNDQWIVAK